MLRLRKQSSPGKSTPIGYFVTMTFCLPAGWVLPFSYHIWDLSHLIQHSGLLFRILYHPASPQSCPLWLILVYHCSQWTCLNHSTDISLSSHPKSLGKKSSYAASFRVYALPFSRIKLTRTPPAPSKLECLSLCLVNCSHCFRLVSQDSFGISWKCCLFLSYYLINWVKSHLLYRFFGDFREKKKCSQKIYLP